MLLAELLDLMPGLVARTGMHNAVMARLKYLRNLFEIPGRVSAQRVIHINEYRLDVRLAYRQRNLSLRDLTHRADDGQQLFTPDRGQMTGQRIA